MERNETEPIPVLEPFPRVTREERARCRVERLLARIYLDGDWDRACQVIHRLVAETERIARLSFACALVRVILLDAADGRVDGLVRTAVAAVRGLGC